MTGNPYKIRGTENEREIVVNHGQFYRSAELVSTLHRGSGGIFGGFRAAHAFGRFYSGIFTATPAARTLSRAAHFQGTPVPVTARFSGVSGDPSQKPSNVVAMATKFYLPDGTVTDLIAITLPAFFARTPEEFIAFVDAARRTRRPASPISQSSNRSSPETQTPRRSHKWCRVSRPS